MNPFDKFDKHARFFLLYAVLGVLLNIGIFAGAVSGSSCGRFESTE